ncbi:MAG: cytoskeleton protein RodZ [Glaciecola sp.]|jgi:cytoskeleton protein RodZ
MTDEYINTKEATVESTQATPGQQLKKGREAQGLTQQQVADSLHLRLGNIQDIESDTHKPGVSITFTKGYVRIYAKLLNMPVEPLLENFDVLHQGEKQPAKLQSFSQRVAKQANDDRWMMVTYLIVFLVIASLVIWWYQQSDKSIMNRLNLFNNNGTEQSSNINEGQSVNAMNNNLNMPDEIAIREEDIKRQSESTNASNVIDSQNAADNGFDEANNEIEKSEVDNPFVGESDDSASNLGSQSIDGYNINSDGTVDVIFTFKEDCWLSVKDAGGEVMAVGVKVKGRVMAVRGIPPISVNMCPPSIVDIDFAGTPVDLSQYRRGVPVQFELAITGQ